MAVQVQNLLIEDVILEQDQVLLRRPLELCQILANIEHNLLIGYESHSIPGNRQRCIAKGSRNDDLRDFRELSGLDDRKITQFSDPLSLHEHTAAQYLA